MSIRAFFTIFALHRRWVGRVTSIALCLNGCIKKTAPATTAQVPNQVNVTKAIDTQFARQISREMIDGAMQQFACQAENDKSRFVDAINEGWNEAEKTFLETANKDLDKWFSATKDTMMSRGLQGAGEVAPNSSDPENQMPSNRCVMLGRTISYSWFFYAVMQQLSTDVRCAALPAERVGSYTALLFFRLQSLQTADGQYADFALPLPGAAIEPPCAAPISAACREAFTARLNLLDSKILSTKNLSSDPKAFAETYCR